MATKPDITQGRWAETSGGSLSSNLTQPTSGKADTGWADDEQPDADQENWLLHEFYKWALYLNDGQLVGNTKITGTLEVTGATTLDGATQVKGFLTGVTSGDLLTIHSNVDVLSRNFQAGGGVALYGDISPPTITSNQDDYNPTGLNPGGLTSAVRIRLAMTADRTLTGIQSDQTGGRILILDNTQSGHNLILDGASTASTATNRFHLLGASLTIPPEGMATLLYDNTEGRWRLLNKNF